MTVEIYAFENYDHSGNQTGNYQVKPHRREMKAYDTCSGFTQGRILIMNHEVFKDLK